MDAYSTISSPGELATYANPKVYGNPFAALGGGAGLGQLSALLGQNIAAKQGREAEDQRMKEQSFYGAINAQRNVSGLNGAEHRGQQWNPNNQAPAMSYVKEMHGFGMTPGAVQTGAGDVGAVQGGWMPGGGNKGAHVSGGGGPIMPASTLPDYGAGQHSYGNGVVKPDSTPDDSQADWLGTGQRGNAKNQLQALIQQLSGK